jgi:hypothetical protein
VCLDHERVADTRARVGRSAVPHDFVVVGDYVGDAPDRPRYSVRFRLPNGRNGVDAWFLEQSDAADYMDMVARGPHNESRPFYVLVDESTGLVLERRAALQ